MPAKCFVDTNVLVYAHDRSSGDKHRKAQELIERLWSDGTGVLSTQVLQEFYVNVRRRTASPPPAAAVRQWIADYLNWDVVVNDANSVLGAIDVEERYRVSFWDALIVQAANVARAAVIYSEDLNHGQRYGDAVVENPFSPDRRG